MQQEESTALTSGLTSQVKLLDGTANVGEDIVGVRADETNRADHNH